MPENTGINKHAIELQNGNQLFYRPIYSLVPVELKTLKIYIKTNLKTGFIWSFKFSAGTSILFDKKVDSGLWFCVNYQDFNIFTIKNRYLLFFMSKTLDQLRKAKQFLQLHLTSAYKGIKIREGNEWKTAFRTWYSHFKH